MEKQEEEAGQVSRELGIATKSMSSFISTERPNESSPTNSFLFSFFSLSRFSLLRERKARVKSRKINGRDRRRSFTRDREKSLIFEGYIFFTVQNSRMN